MSIYYENDGNLKFDEHTLFWREFKAKAGKRVYGRFRRAEEIGGCNEANYEAVTVADLFKDLYNALFTALCEELILKED